MGNKVLFIKWHSVTKVNNRGDFLQKKLFLTNND